MDSDIYMESESESLLFPKNKRFQKQALILSHKDKAISQLQILPAQCSTVVESILSKEKDTMSKDSSKQISSLMAGKKARQRKKQYIEGLQGQIKHLEEYIEKYGEQIKKTKQTLNEALNSNKNNENSITYNQLEICLESDDPNEDKINLLLDMIKFRMGASGKERQAKLQYYFKQIISLMFPAIHRYLMYCSEKQEDLFQEQNIDHFFGNCNVQIQDSTLTWTKQLFNILDLTSSQKLAFLKFKSTLQSKKVSVKRIIQELNDVKQCIKNQGSIFQQQVNQIRHILRPKQAAQMVLFIQTYKYKRQINLSNQSYLLEPHKKIKP